MDENMSALAVWRAKYATAERLAVLAGAGVSYDAPSRLPTAAPIMKAIVDAIAADLEPAHTVLTQACTPEGDASFLRMERLLSLVYPNNTQPRAISVLAKATVPNRNHLALARLGGRGAMILTTNFDLLIERACEQLGVSFRVAVEEDEYQECLQAPPDGTCWIVKLHGSAERLASVSATLEHVGQGRGGFSPWGAKGKVTGRVLSTRNLVVTGYSGSDDFDVIPMFLAVGSDRQILWLDHCGDQSVHEAEVVRMESGFRDVSPKVRQVLNAMVFGKRPIRPREAVSAMRVHSREALEAFAGGGVATPPPASEQKVAAELLSALRQDCEARYAEPLRRLTDASILLEELARYDLALHCAERGRELAARAEDAVREGRFLQRMASLLYTRGETTRALDLARQAVRIAETEEDTEGLSTALTTLAYQVRATDRRQEAIPLLERAIELDERLGRDDWLATDRGVLAVSLAGKEPERARALHRQALDDARSRGDMGNELALLNNAFLVAGLQANDEEVEEMLTRARTLATALGDRRAEVQLLGNYGSQLENRGEWTDAVSAFRRAVEVADEIGFRKGSAAWRSALGDLLRRQGPVQEARAVLERALEDLTTLDDRPGIATACGRLGLLWMAVDPQDDRARSYLERALELDRELGFEQGVVDDLQNLGQLEQKTGRFDRAEDYFKEAIELARSLGYRAALARNLGNLGVELSRRGDHERALSLDEEALRINLELGNREGETATRLNLAGDYLQLQWHDRALAQALHGRHLAQQLQLDEVVARADRLLGLYDLEQTNAAACLSLGERLVVQGCPEVGLPWLERAVEKAESQSEEVATTLALARTLAAAENPVRAMELYDRALTRAAESGNDELEASVRITVGESLRRSSRLRQAAAHFREALRLLESSENRELVGLANGNLGNALRQMNDVEGSVLHTEKAIQISGEAGDERNLARWLGNRGLLHLEQGEPKSAVRLFEQGKAIQERLDDHEGVARKELGLGQAARALGDPERAADHLERSITLFRALGDGHGEAEARLELGWLLGEDPDRAVRQFERARELLTGRHPQWPREISGELRVLISEMRRDHVEWAHVPDEVLAAKILSTDGAEDPSADISRLLTAAHRLLDRGSLEDAETLLDKALAESRARSDIVGENKSLAAFGKLWLSRGELDRAEETFETVLHRLGDGERSGLSAQVRFNLANLQIQSGEAERARRTFLELIELSKRDSGEDYLAPSFLGLGNLAWQVGRLDEAEGWFRQAVDVGRRTHDDKHVARALGNLAVIRLAQDQPQEAVRLHEESAALCRRLEDYEALANQYGGLSAARARLGELSAAFELRSKALEIFSRLGLQTRIAESEVALAALWLERAKDPTISEEQRGEAVMQSAELSARALNWFEHAGIPGDSIKAAVHLGLALKSLGDSDRACSAFRRANELAEDLGDPGFISLTRQLLSGC